MNTLLPELNKRYLPEQLGYPFPEVRSVWIGRCPGKTPEHTGVLDNTVAHVHQCSYDELYGTICINEPKYVDDITMWHEYAHVMDFHFIGHYWGICLSLEDAEYIGYAEASHGPTWRELLTQWGKAHYI